MSEAENSDSRELEILTTAGWAARTLGVSVARVWALVTRGELSTPTRKGSDAVFDEQEVLALVGRLPSKAPIKLPRRGEGELYACLFGHFKAEMSLTDIVILEKVSPATVNKAYAEYKAGLRGTRDEGMSLELRGRLEVLARKERIKALDVELAEARARNRESRQGTKAELERSKVHERTMSLIVGAKK